MTKRATLEFDWEQAYAKLEQARQALEEGRRESPEETRRLLDERARALAQPEEGAAAAADTREVLVFSVEHGRYGIGATRILDVTRLLEVTPLPSTPSHLLGVVSHRGRIVPVLDLRRLSDPGAPAAAGGLVVVVEISGMVFGLLADAVDGIARVAADDVLPLPSGDGEGEAFVQGVTGEMVAVLDLEAIVRSARIEVSDHAGRVRPGEGVTR